MIDGVKIVPLKIFPDERGAIMHGVRRDTMLNEFGEVYFSKIYEGAIKGWHVHETLMLNYICVFGQVKIVMHDLRPKSKTEGETQEVFLGQDNYALLHIPPGIANGTKSLWDPFAIVANITNEPHDPKQKYRRIHPDEGVIPYDWERKIF